MYPDEYIFIFWFLYNYFIFNVINSVHFVFLTYKASSFVSAVYIHTVKICN